MVHVLKKQILIWECTLQYTRTDFFMGSMRLRYQILTFLKLNKIWRILNLNCNLFFPGLGGVY